MFGKREEKGTFCPYLKGQCVKHKCIKWVKIIGLHPQTGQQVDQEACADAWLPIILVDLSKQLVQVQASIQSHRNEEISRMDTIQAGVQNVANAFHALRVMAKRAMLMAGVRDDDRNDQGDY
jgi:hypothetical protein